MVDIWKTCRENWVIQTSVDSHNLVIKKGSLDGKIFSVVVFGSIKKGHVVIKMVTVDWYLMLPVWKRSISGGLWMCIVFSFFSKGLN